MNSKVDLRGSYIGAGFLAVLGCLPWQTALASNGTGVFNWFLDRPELILAIVLAIIFAVLLLLALVAYPRWRELYQTKPLVLFSATLVGAVLGVLLSVLIVNSWINLPYNPSAGGASVNLAWNASPSANTGGYIVAYGQNSGSYTANVDVGNVTSYTVQGLQEGSKYYFAAKAYNSDRTLQSAYSNEVNLTIPVAIALTADFTLSKTSGIAGFMVNFTPVTTGNVTSWAWAFPGSTTPIITNSTGQVVSVTYPTAGVYSASLTATGPNGSVTKTYPNLITVTTATADFTASPVSGVASLVVNFTPVTAGTFTTWTWDLPGSSTPSIVNSTAQAVSATYPSAGSYPVTLTASGSSGSVTKTYPNLIAVTAALPTATAPPAASKTSLVGLVAAYDFDGINGLKIADASGTGNLGTIKEAVSITTGHSGNALKFDGVNDWVTINDSASLDPTTGMTLEAWVYPQSLTGGGKTVILKEKSGGEVYALYAREDANLPVSYFNDGGSYHGVFGTKALTLNQWTHLVGTYDGKYQRLYVNGSQVAQQAQSSSIQQSTGELRIGGNSLWSEFFNGYIDEVRIYNRALTPAEVSYNMATAVSVSNPSQFFMGDKTIEPGLAYKPQGTAQAFKAIPQKTGVITSIKVYLDAGSTATELVAGVYKDNNGHPGGLVAQGKLKLLKSGAWNSVPIAVAPVTAAQPYWLAVLGSKGQFEFRNLIGSAASLIETSASTTLTTLPSTWTRSTIQANSAMSVYGLGY
jgi:PKD repeat protein